MESPIGRQGVSDAPAASAARRSAGTHFSRVSDADSVAAGFMGYNFGNFVRRMTGGGLYLETGKHNRRRS